MNDREKINRIRQLLDEANTVGAEPAEFLFEHGLEERANAKWLRDKTYQGKDKDVFICNACLHWQSVKKLKPDQVLYMKYCPFCGARMEV